MYARTAAVLLNLHVASGANHLRSSRHEDQHLCLRKGVHADGAIIVRAHLYALKKHDHYALQ